MSSGLSITSAEEKILASIDQMLGENENALSVPMTSLNQAVSSVVDVSAKGIKRLTEKVLSSASKNLTANDNRLDAITTGLLGGIDTWLSETHYLLSQLAAKGGLMTIGSPLETALEGMVVQSPELEIQGTLLLAVQSALSIGKQLIEVLREIRDRLPAGTAIEPGEPPAQYPSPEVAGPTEPEIDPDIEWYDGGKTEG